MVDGARWTVGGGYVEGGGRWAVGGGHVKGGGL